MRLYVREDFRSYLCKPDVFAQIQSIDGEVFKEKDGRRTLRFYAEGKSFFLKYHNGVGWREIFKNLFQLRLPVLGAKNEFYAANKLKELGVGALVPVAYGVKGWNPAGLCSFLITEDLSPAISLEKLCADWPVSPPSFKTKKWLIENVAILARKMHQGGINHRDFYICHILVDKSSLGSASRPDAIKTYVIDLHRAQIRKKTPFRWLVKDLASLYFSVIEIGLTKRDVYRFLKTYFQKDLQRLLKDEKDIIDGAQKRAIFLCNK